MWKFKHFRVNAMNFFETQRLITCKMVKLRPEHTDFESWRWFGAKFEADPEWFHLSARKWSLNVRSLENSWQIVISLNSRSQWPLRKNKGTQQVQFRAQRIKKNRLINTFHTLRFDEWCELSAKFKCMLCQVKNAHISVATRVRLILHVLYTKMLCTCFCCVC